MISNLLRGFTAKLCIAVLLAGMCCHVVNAQEHKVSVSVKNGTIEQLLNQIEQKEGFIFLYSKDLFNPNKQVSISVNNEPLESVLKRVLDSNIDFKITDNQVVFYKKAAQTAEPKPVQKPQEPVQSRKIKGIVKDVNGEPLAGVAVIEEGTNNGVITDLDGLYEIVVHNPNKPILVFSALGYANTTLAVSAQRDVLNAVLEEDTTDLQEAVVIGYGTQERATVTGALSTIASKELVKTPVSSISNILAGAAPGVSTVQTTGQPGADAAKIYVRGMGSLTDGASSPLVLVDGVERDFSQIDPNEIENFSILKDASSTAVFGIRGANGVILITTKRGNEGKPSINFSSSNGIQQPLSYVSQTGSYEYARFWNIKHQNDNITDQSQYFTREAIEAYRTGADPIMYPNMKWDDLMFNKVFLQSKNNINISGGGKNVKYFVSLGYFYQNGMLKQLESLPYDNNYKHNRYNYRANVDFNITKTTLLKFNLGGMVGTTQEPRTVANENEWVYATIWAVPMSGPGFINGVRTLVPEKFVPKVELRDGYSTFYGMGYNQYSNMSLNIDVELSQKLDFITKGLSLSVKGAFDNYYSMNKYHTGSGLEYQRVYYASYLADSTKPQTDPDYDKTQVFVPQGSNKPLTYSENYGRDRNWYLEGKVNYDRTFGANNEHKVTGLFLYNQSRDYYPTVSNGTSPYVYIPRSYVGFVGRATYGYKGRYLLDVNMGYNGSENFAPGRTRYGFFPSISAGWVISDEPWMEKVKFISYLKLRASYGRVGNDRSTSRFMYTPSVWSSSGSYSFGAGTPSNLPAFGHSVPGNNLVSWETADKQNYGIDMNLFHSRLSLNLDIFYDQRTGILMTPNSTPSIIATTSPALNIGEVDNYGYEIALGWKDSTPRGFSYYVNANMSFARNRIVYMDEVPNNFAYQNQTGGPSGRYTNVWKFERIYQYSDFHLDENGKYILNENLPQPNETVYPGDAMYADLNGDGFVNSDDTMVTGYSSRPEYVFGLNAGFNWKGLSFSMQWAGATHVDKMLQIEYRIPYTNAGGRGLLQYFYDNCWSPENQSGTLPRAAETSEQWNSKTSTLWLKDASYLRLKTISLGYTFTGRNKALFWGIKSLGINLTGYNLLTFTPLEIMDPESMADNNGGYPLVKIYSIGLNLNF